MRFAPPGGFALNIIMLCVGTIVFGSSTKVQYLRFRLALYGSILRVMLEC
jgi:hypothetical protein